jgi:hypothetical protein
MLLHRLNSNVLVIRNNNWSRDWLSPAFFVFLSALWHVLLFPLIFEFDDQFVYWFTHGIFLVLMLLNWPITESVVLDKAEKTVSLKRRLLLKTTSYKTSLEGVKDVTTEHYKKRVRLSLSFADGMCFPLSTYFFPSKLIEDDVTNDIRDFLGFKKSLRKKSPKVSKPAPVEVNPSELPAAVDPESDSESSESSIDENDPHYDSDGQLNWDKAIEDWEHDVKERKTVRA